MTDIFLAVICVALLSAGMFAFGLWLGRRRPRWPSIVALMGVGSLYLCYFFMLRDSVLLIRLIPLSGVAIAGDPAPWLAGLPAACWWASGVCIGLGEASLHW